MLISPATSNATAGGWRDARAGFTLIEVTLALAVVAMLAILGLPHVRSSTNAALIKSKISEITSLLRSDRNRALRFARTTRVRIDASKGVIQSEASGIKIDIPDGIVMRVSADAISGIAFDGNGRSTGGRVVLAAHDTAYAVDVNPVTAAVKVSELRR